MAPKIVVHVDSSAPIDLEISVKDGEATVSVAGSSSDKVRGKGCKGIEKEGSSMTSGALGKCKNEGYVKIEKDDGEKTTSYEDWDVVPASSGSPHPPSHCPSWPPDLCDLHPNWRTDTLPHVRYCSEDERKGCDQEATVP